MVYWILFGVCFVIQCFSTPLFLKLSWPTRSMKSLTAKMVCATMFVSVGFLSSIIAENTSAFATTMLLGLLFGWVGDFFLHSERNSFFVIGFISFLVGHVVYIKAYLDALSTFENYNPFNIIEMGVIISLGLLGILSHKRLKIEFSMKALKFAVFVYTIVLITMFVKATSLGVNYMLSGGKYGIGALAVLSLGSLLFVMSDATIGVLMFGGQKKNRPLKIFNIVTYFAGQMLLATSILFINI